MILVQMKGGSASNPDADAVQRLRAVKQHYRAKEVMLFRWTEGKESKFSKLTDDNAWHDCGAKELFG